MKMNEAVRVKWLAALRSGEYKQGTNFLQKEDEFCCLGVLCDLAVKEGVIPPGEYSDDWGPDVKVMLFAERSSLLPEAIVKWAGFEHDNPQIDDIPLGYMNDKLGKTFSEIADAIESGVVA